MYIPVGSRSRARQKRLRLATRQYAHVRPSKGSAMALFVSVQVVQARKLAAVRRRVMVGDVASAWRPALDRFGSSCAASPDFAQTGTMFSFITILRTGTRQWTSISASR
jgi:hypothetical protein